MKQLFMVSAPLDQDSRWPGSPELVRTRRPLGRARIVPAQVTRPPLKSSPGVRTSGGGQHSGIRTCFAHNRLDMLFASHQASTHGALCMPICAVAGVESTQSVHRTEPQFLVSRQRIKITVDWLLDLAQTWQPLVPPRTGV